jgi:hypothetical protein
VIAIYLFARPPSTSVASTSLASSWRARAHFDFAPSLNGAGGAMRIAGSF